MTEKKTLRQPPGNRRVRGPYSRKPVRFDVPPAATTKQLTEAPRRLHEEHGKKKATETTKRKPPPPLVGVAALLHFDQTRRSGDVPPDLVIDDADLAELRADPALTERVIATAERLGYFTRTKRTTSPRGQKGNER